MALTLAHRVYYVLIPGNQFSFKLHVDITSGQIVRHMMFNFSVEEMMRIDLDHDDATFKEGLLNFLKDFGISMVAIQDLLSELFLKSTYAIESAAQEGFNGIVFFVMQIEVFPPEESDEAIEAIIEEQLYEARFKPAAKASIRALKTIKFEKQNAAARTSSCVICLEGFIDGLELTELPCGHDFHGDCVVQWLNTSHMCPVCRFSLPCEEEE